MRYRILVIEDDAGVAQTIQHTLVSAGYDVRSTLDGTDALQVFDCYKPDLIITDVIMFEIDTIDTIVEFRNRRPGIKIIAVSGNDHLLLVAAKHGANHVLAKPFSAKQLNTLVKACCSE